MQIRLRDMSNVLQTVTRIRMRDAGNVLRTIQQVRMRDATNTLRTVFSYFTVELDTDALVGFDSGAAISGSVTTSADVTATPTGGTAPYSYAWSRVSGTPEVEIDSPTAATTSFTVAVAYDDIDYIASFICTVTDNVGNIIESEEVDVECHWISTL